VTEQIKSKVADGAKGAAPWRRGVPWWLVLIEGIGLLALGLYMFVAPVKSRVLLAEILAASLGITGAVQLIALLRAKEKGPLATLGIVRGAVGLAVGVIILLMLLLDARSIDVGRAVLGLGSLAYGGIGLYILYKTHETRAQLAAIVNSSFFVFVGLIMLIDLLGGNVFATMTTAINFVLLLVGAFLILWSLVLRRKKQKAAVA
jgi:uncharacterized membrane protein HdeD (DUF308 family)